MIPIGTIFPVPFDIQSGLPLSNTWSPEARNDTSNGTLYIAADFWDRDHTVSCTFPCAILFPPFITTTTWFPPPITYTTLGKTISTTVPPHTTEQIRISRTTVESRKPTQTISPSPAKRPLCFTLPLTHVRICPPDLLPFPPPIPVVTIIPVPPGGKPGPTNVNNQPTPDQEQEEDEEDDEEDEDGGLCYPILVGDDGLGGDGDLGNDGESGGSSGEGIDDSYPGAGGDHNSGAYTTTFGGAGFGNPTTSTSTTTVTQTEVGTVAPHTSFTYSFGPHGETTVVCESLGSATISTITLPSCAGSSTTITSTPTTPSSPPPGQTVHWAMYQKEERTMECM